MHISIYTQATRNENLNDDSEIETHESYGQQGCGSAAKNLLVGHCYPAVGLEKKKYGLHLKKVLERYNTVSL